LVGLVLFGAIAEGHLLGTLKKSEFPSPGSQIELRRINAYIARTCKKARTSVSRSSRQLPEVTPEFASGRFLGKEGKAKRGKGGEEGAMDKRWERGRNRLVKELTPLPFIF
jgi:hypothetical protein